jgi:hypothetical protein
MRTIGERMALGEIRCCCISNYVATERHHPKGPTFETGTGLKAHDWLIIPLSKQAHDEDHTDAMAWEQRYGTHAELLLAFWGSIGFIPGPYMTVGMNPKCAAWLDRVLERLKRN